MAYHLIEWLPPDFMEASDLGCSVNTLAEKEEEERKIAEDYNYYSNQEYVSDYKYRKLKRLGLLL